MGKSKKNLTWFVYSNFFEFLNSHLIIKNLLLNNYQRTIQVIYLTPSSPSKPSA